MSLGTVTAPSKMAPVGPLKKWWPESYNVRLEIAIDNARSRHHWKQLIRSRDNGYQNRQSYRQDIKKQHKRKCRRHYRELLQKQDYENI